MMKNLYITTIAMGITLMSMSQVIDTNWVRQYDRTTSSSKVLIAEMPNGDYLLNQHEQFYQIGINGDSIDAAVESTNWGLTQAMIGTSEGVLLAGSHNSFPAIALMDTNFNIVWTKALSSNASGSAFAVYSDGTDFYASGRHGFSSDFITKFDATGDTAWYTIIPQTTFSQLSDIIELSDGNFLATGNLDDYPLAVKFNGNGDTIWTYTEYIFISFYQARAYERSNGEIVILAERFMIELNDDGIKISDTNFTVSSFYDMKYQNDTVYLFGTKRDTIWGNEKWPVVEIRNSNFDSLGTWRYEDNLHPFADNVLTTAIQTPGGGFIAVGKMRDSVNITANTYNILAVKFNDGTVNDTITYIPDFTQQNEVQVFPIPTQQVINIHASSAMHDVNLIDACGRKVRILGDVETSTQLDLSTIPSGVYYLVSKDSKPIKILKQ